MFLSFLYIYSSLDILSTIHVDTELETEQNNEAVQASLLLVQGLRYNEDITKGTEDKANASMQVGHLTIAFA